MNDNPFAATSADAAGTPLIDVPAARWLDAALHVRDALGMDFFDWLSAVDMPDGDPAGVDVVVHVAGSRSTGGPAGDATAGGDPPGAGDAAAARGAMPGDAAPGGVRRLLLRTRVPDTDPHLASLTSVWPGAAWHERETFEMFGVTFDGFDDGSGDWLRPLLLPDGFEGTPLRKTFVLAARASKPWPGAKEPGESDAHAAPGRRKTLPPGVPDPVAWGPRAPGTEPVASASAPAPRPAAASTVDEPVDVPAATPPEDGSPGGRRVARPPRRAGAGQRHGDARPARQGEEPRDA